MRLTDSESTITDWLTITNCSVDYVVWNGANPSLGKGSSAKLAENGSQQQQLKKYVPKGANPELCKGPKAGLSKGSNSLYSKVGPSLLWV